MKGETFFTPEARFASNNLLIRLQRNQRDLIQLNQKLNSYTCEPSTPDLYEEIQSLRMRLKQLSDSNDRLIDSIKGHKKPFDDVGEGVMRQICDFNELRKGVFDYSRVASSH